ncbi:hypothetical protein NIES4101_46280 [Calothrix sp. NIES-4101]|nr:hypothetical protein NIES4101_46280 [Calothrix sp. NIES-4101]
MQSVTINKSISKNIDSTNQNSRIILFDNTLPSGINENRVLSVNGYLKGLKAYANITSLAEAPIPAIELTDTDQDKIIKVLNIEWGNERIGLDLQFSENGTNFITLGSVSLINQQGYPFRNYSLLDFYTDSIAAEIGTNGVIACEVKDQGYGKLGAGDVLSVYGSVTQEIVFNEFIVSNDVDENTISLDAATSTPVVSASTIRTGLTIFNDSTEKVYLGYNSLVDNTNYSIPLSPNKGYEFPQPIYTGAVYAYSVNASVLQVSEFFYVI